MTQITLHNTLTRKKEPFTPLDPSNVRLYLCGPTVYDRAHIGNARPVLVFDVLFRLLRHVYGETAVTYVRNFTDVDDKINARAAETGRSIRDITDETIEWYLQDMASLGALEPTHMPRATEYIPQMIAMIATLIDKGYAYAAEGHVLFSVGSDKHYGKLSGRSVDDMIAGARVEVAPYKRDPMDFVLWKPSDGDTPGWDSPWGIGRPGWHIECSAMADDLLWANQRDRLSPKALAHPHVIDIHGGGNDLMFPHHENELAQSCCANGSEVFANVWLHNEMLQVEGKKMSKSLGNFFTVRDLLDQSVPGEVIRFVFLSTHYRKPMDWTDKKRKEAASVLHDWHETTMALSPTPESDFIPDAELIEALADDLNTHLCLVRLKFLSHEPQALLDNARYIGFLSDDARADYLKLRKRFAFGAGSTLEEAHISRELDSLRFRLVELRDDALKSKNFDRVDDLKARLIASGIEVRMSKAGVELVPGPNFDPAKLEGLL